MNTAQRAKLSAGVGIIAMLFGALMVIAPGGASAQDASPVAPTPIVVRGNATCPTSTSTFKFDSPFNVDGDSDTRSVVLPGDTEPTSVEISYTSKLVDGVRHYTWTSNTSVVRVIVKQGPDSALFDYPPGTLTGAAYVALLSGTTASPSGTSHMSFCLGESTPTPTPTGQISIDKTVSGAAPDGDPVYGFTVSCMLGEVAVELDPAEAAFTLTEDAPVKVIAGLPVGTECTVTETETQNASSTSIKVDDGSFELGTSAEDVVIGDDTTRAVVVDNYYEPKLIVEKQVENRSDWSFDFEICAQPLSEVASEGEDQVQVPQDCDEFTLTDEEPTKEFDGPGGFEVTEIGGSPDGWTLTDIECTPETDTSLEAATAWVWVGETQVTTCTFTNTYPGQTTTVITTPPTTLPEPEPASLRVVKEVTGPGDIPDTWTVGFEIASLGDTVREFSLSQVAGVATTGDLTEGSYTVTETVPSGDESSLTDVDCLDAEGAAVTSSLDERTLTVSLDEGDDVTCTFINAYPEVLDTEVTVAPTEETVAPTTTPTTPAPEVKGDTVVQTLPRTGSGTTSLAGFGALLLAAGAALVISANRRQANIH